MAYEAKKFSPAELAEFHALPDDSLLTAQVAASASSMERWPSITAKAKAGEWPAFASKSWHTVVPGLP